MKTKHLLLPLISLAIGRYDAIAQDCNLNQPTPLKITDISNCSATLHWRAASNASDYMVKYRASTSNQWSAKIDAGLDTFFIFTNLNSNTRYVFAVQSICSNGTKSVFSSVTAKTSQCTLPSVTGTQLMPSGQIKINLTFECNPDTIYYRYKTLNGSWNQLFALNSDSVLISKLDFDSTYTYQVSTCRGHLRWTRADTFVYENRPNILLIVMDDSRYDTYSCQGAPSFFTTPNIDRIHDQGVNFENNFVVYSYCSPGRSSIVTGLYPHKSGVEKNAGTLFPGVLTLPTILHNSGYHTGIIGKYFYSNDESDFDYALKGYLEYNNSTYNLNGTNLIIPGHNTNILTDTAIKFIERSTQPFYLWVGYKATHVPITPQESYAGLYANNTMPLAGNLQRYTENYLSAAYEMGNPNLYRDSAELVDEWERYFETLKGVDDGIGKILHTLDSLDITDNTMIIFTSDNGHLFGEHGFYSKWFAYDPSIRVPIFIRYPKMFQPGCSVTNAVTLNIDIAPTILQAAGVPNTFNMDGVSLKEFSDGTAHRSSMLYEYGYRMGPLPYIRSVRDFRFKYILYGCNQQTEELFDLVNDPEENINLVNNSFYADTLALYRQKLSTLQDFYADTIRAPIVECHLENPQAIRFTMDEEDELSVTIFPNPAEDFFTVQFTPNEAAQAEIISDDGEVVSILSITDNSTLDISYLPSGTYFLRLTVDKNVYSRSFVVQR